MFPIKESPRDLKLPNWQRSDGIRGLMRCEFCDQAINGAPCPCDRSYLARTVRRGESLSARQREKWPEEYQRMDDVEVRKAGSVPGEGYTTQRKIDDAEFGSIEE